MRTTESHREVQMKKLQRLLAIATALALLLSTIPLQADEGDCYQQCSYRKLRPEWAIGGLAVVAIVAVCLQNSDPGNTVHSH
jgi:hypothetical protein